MVRMRSWTAPSVGVDVHVARRWRLRLSAMVGRAGVQWFPDHPCLRPATLTLYAGAAAPHIVTLRFPRARWNQFEVLYPNLSKHDAQPWLFCASGITV